MGDHGRRRQPAERARKQLGDALEGIHTTPDGETVAALGPPNRRGGLLADGALTRTELERAVFTTAVPGEFDPNAWTYDPIVVPTTDVYYTQQGYGIASAGSAFSAIDVITGAKPMPDRSDVDAWIALVDSVRETVYPSPTYP